MRRFRPTTVSGGLGTVPASQVDTSGEVPPPRTMTAKEAERLMVAELLQAARSLTASTTALADQLGGRQGAINGVLGVRLHKFANGEAFNWDLPVVVGSILVTNHSATFPITYSSGDEKGQSAPTTGAGRALVEKGQTVPIAVGTRAFTIWGTDGESITVQAFTGLQAFGLNR